MPQYTFDCPQHGPFRLALSIMKHRDPYPCPKCEEPAPQIVEQTAPPILRGKGFHANEYGAPYRGT